MSEAVTAERWREAQGAEQQFWTGVATNAVTVARILESAAVLADWAAARLPEQVAGEPTVEIGIGPLGVGCAHFLGGPDRGEIIGVEPLEPVPEDALRLPAPLLAAVRACRSEAYRHVNAMGEETGLPSESYKLVVLGNMLDHVQDPSRVLAEASRLLQPGGHVLMSCDVFSELGRLKHKLYAQRRQRETILVKAHPFRFRARDLRALLAEARFTQIAEQGAADRVRELAGRSDLMFLLAQKSA